MKDKLWFLITDSLLEACAGAGEIMNNSIDIGLELLSEIENIDSEAIKKELYQVIDEVYEAFDYDPKNWRLMVELIEYKFTKIKTRIDAGEFTKELV